MRKTDPLLAVNGPIILSPGQRASCTRIRANMRAEEARRMRDRLAYHLGHFLLGDNAEVNMELAKLLAKCLSEGLASYHTLDNNKREWLRCAVEYFVLEDDTTPDAGEGIGGLNDDATVISAVLEHCGFHELAKQIPDFLA